MTSTSQPAAHSNLSQHILVALALAAISLSAFAAVDYGNNMGIDDWIHFYQSYFLHSPGFSNRPLALILLTIVTPFIKADYSAYHVILLFIRALTAFLGYLLIWQLAPKQKLFAFAGGVAIAVFLLRDSFYVVTLLYPNDNFSALIAVMTALNIFVVALTALTNRARYQYLLGGVSFAAGVAACLIRETTIPLLLGVPFFITFLKRPLTGRTIGFYTLWCAVIVIAAMRYVLPIFGVGASTYGSALFQDFDLMRMLAASRHQMEFAFSPVIQVDFQNLYQQRVLGVLVLAIVFAAFALLRPRLWQAVDELQGRDAIGHYGLWLAASVAATWLGFAAFLPTVFASSYIRTHILSGPGEVIALISAIWLVSHFAQNVKWRLAVRLVGVAWVAMYGISMAGNLQAELYSYAATWDNTAYFMRSLSHLAPTVKSPTLFVYIENRETEETPFVSGFSFQYAVRYFYGNTATGLVPSDNIMGDWSISDAGIFMEETWIEEPQVFGWDQLIVLTRETSGHLIILDKLPERFLTAYRQSLYRPFDRIAPAFIPSRVRETFPILSGPDWSGNDYLLQNK